MKSIIIKCDLCNSIIEPYNHNGQGLIFGCKENQVGPIDICQSCCKVLSKASKTGLLTLHLDKFYEAAGFVEENGVWINANLRRDT